MISHITVSDDLAFIANSGNEMQYMLDDSGDFSNQDRYIIHPTKSSVLAYPKQHKKVEQRNFQQYSKSIKLEASTVHLGIHRDISIKVNIEEKINLARKSAYSLIGARLHAGNGLSQSICAHMWTTYIVPNLTNGLEGQRLTKMNIEKLEKFQRKCLIRFTR